MNYYYMDKRGKACGPYNRQQMQELLFAGIISHTTPCRVAEKHSWVPLQLQPWLDSLGREPIFYECPYCGGKQSEDELTPRCSGCGKYLLPDGYGMWAHVRLAFCRIMQLRGRSGRMEYWGWWLGLIGIRIFLYLVALMLGYWFQLFFEISVLLMMPLSWTVITRRLHDVGLSGKWCIPWCAIDVGFVVFILVVSVLFATDIVSYSLYHGLGSGVVAVSYLYGMLQVLVHVGLLVLGCIDSQRGTNKYGSSSKIFLPCLTQK